MPRDTKFITKVAKFFSNSALDVPNFSETEIFSRNYISSEIWERKIQFIKSTDNLEKCLDENVR